ncbi:MAG TPA: S1 RNA-binding domain-containing protein [Patescibacteria group bacterium]|nr:S1 RNA-binding domain-containing protein [Patescibacteria group bacterium]
MNDENKSGSFANLLKTYSTDLPKNDDLVKGKVISVGNGEVRLDIGGVITGVVRGEELFSESEDFANIKVGDEVEATVLEQENENGEMELSFRAAGHRVVWAKMAKCITDGVTIKAKVVQVNKGGLMMQVDALMGFMPVSQLNPDHYPRVQGGDKNRILEHLKQFIGQDFQVKVLDANENEDKLIVSEKAVWEDDQKAVLDSYKVGNVIEGEISALTSFGAFVRFGEGLEGLVHISEIVWQRIDHPKDVLKVGQRVKAQIIDINRSKIYLSIKRLVEDPWKAVKDKYKIGQEVEGEIHKVENFGLMVKLDEEIHGLAHISELSDSVIKDLGVLRDRFKIGDRLKFAIVSIEPSEHRLGLKLSDDSLRIKQEGSDSKTETKEEVKEVIPEVEKSGEEDPAPAKE